jgi:hypothetical protein
MVKQPVVSYLCEIHRLCFANYHDNDYTNINLEDKLIVKIYFMSLKNKGWENTISESVNLTEITDYWLFYH